MSQKVLVIEDHQDIQEILSMQLVGQGFVVTTTGDGKSGLEQAQTLKPDLILLDLMLPKMDGLTVCKELKKNKGTQHIPIIMLTAKDSSEDVVKGLEVGADDYVSKPFDAKELLARVKAVLRRSTAQQEQTVKYKNLEINPSTFEVLINKKLVAFTLTEFRLLEVMVSGKGKIFTRDQLIDKVRGENIVIVDRNIDVHMASIRKKLGTYGDNILTVRGVGYRFLDTP